MAQQPDRDTRVALESMLTWLRNGATVAGADPVTIEFREKCIERAYVIASQDLAPALLGGDADSVYNQHLHNLMDVSSMMQKQVIQRPLKRPTQPAPTQPSSSRDPPA